MGYLWWIEFILGFEKDLVRVCGVGLLILVFLGVIRDLRVC